MKISQFLYIDFLKTVWFNFRYLPVREALRMPVLLSRDIKVRKCKKRSIEFVGGAKTATLRFGFGDRMISANHKGIISISGKMIIVGKGVHAFGTGIRLLIGPNGVLHVGNNFTSSVNNMIGCSKSITIGDDNMWSFDNVIMDNDAHQILSSEDKVINHNSPIVFGNHVWLGCRNIVLKGTVIPDGCIVASGSKITSVYSLNNSIIGSQKRVIKEDVRWKRDKSI